MRLPEFTIKVPHPDPSHSANVYIHLNTKCAFLSVPNPRR